jgi:glycine/D-amino acid oxidase-like deaminating enzyme
LRTFLGTKCDLFTPISDLTISPSLKCRLLHPLSPRGKVVHWGLEGFESAAKLVQTALQYRPECVLRTNLYRVALTDQHVDDLQDTARQVPQFCTWVEADDMIQQAGTDPQSTRGGLLVAGLVVHVPTYLEGLWHSCCSKSGAIVWQMVSQDALPSSVSTLRTKHDVVVWAAGAGMLRQPDLIGTRLPIELVRGQSLEFIMPSSDFDQSAVVCGKYVSPLPKPDRVMVGATHEHSSTTMPREQLTQELRQQTESLAPRIWGEGQIDKVISGWRVQSQRTRYGRLPIIGRLKDNEWIFTGLSSRGLLYHGIYGDKLTDMILADDESTVLNDFAHVGWWKNLVTL